MIILRMAGKILLLPVWLLLATAHLLVKIAVEIYCIGKGLINLILGFMLIGTLLWYRQWERFALLAVAGGTVEQIDHGIACIPVLAGLGGGNHHGLDVFVHHITVYKHGIDIARTCGKRHRQRQENH